MAAAWKRAGILSFLVPLLVGCATAAHGQEAPYDPLYRGSAQVQAGPGAACGLIETSASDPNWVMVTSDRILRANLCLASSPCSAQAWYDKPFNPCYPDNRFWKLAPNSGTAFAFPLTALGVGTFDGLYLRRHAKLQFYSGTNEGAPYGAELTGPKYVSIDYWRDVNVACDGFEPGTFFVSGGPGALGNYSLRIGGEAEIEEVRTLEEENEAAHHTDAFAEGFVLRRGTTFDLEVKLSPEYGPGCHQIYLEASPEFGGDTITIPASEGPVPEGQWGAQVIDVTTNGDESKTARVRVSVPGDVAIGAYQLSVFARLSGQQSAKKMDLPDPVIFLFNPWSDHDAVFLSDDASRKEYVLATRGAIWRGSATSNQSKTWGFSQFSKESLDVALQLMNGLASATRGDADLVSRHFSSVVNNTGGGDTGIIVGNWSGNYSGGENPDYWSSSQQLIGRYAQGANPVRYGQCWVFGGVLTTFLRTLGIPARPLSNFNSAHDADHPLDKIVDYYFDASGNLDHVRTHDSVWNFHVWTDAWIGEWKAVDATPQELSGGAYQMGPAPHAAIRGNAGGAYDVDFVFAEVDADIRKWGIGADSMDRLISTSSTTVGRNISTKSIGSFARSDITSSYKTPEASIPRVAGAPMARLTLPGSDVEVETLVPDIVDAGDPIVWTVRLTNHSMVARQVKVVIGGKAVSYDGTVLGDVGAVTENVALDPSKTDEVLLTVTPTTYGAWTHITDTFEVSLFAEVAATAEQYADVARTLIRFPKAEVTLTPMNDVPVGGSGTLTFKWRNPLPDAVEDSELALLSDNGLRFEGQEEIKVPTGTIDPNELLVVTKAFGVAAPGELYGTAVLRGSNVHDIFVDFVLNGFADCNGNMVPDGNDINGGGSSDCDGNQVPDECQPDCDHDGEPDACELENGTALDCDDSGAPDDCEIGAGTRPDDNGNGIPDGCDPDCNGNHRPDDLDIATGASSDANHNGVPDDCDFDCNSNSISDELDIAEGRSQDVDSDGVPDECEAAALPTPSPTPEQSNTPSLPTVTPTTPTATPSVGGTVTIPVIRTGSYVGSRRIFGTGAPGLPHGALQIWSVGADDLPDHGGDDDQLLGSGGTDGNGSFQSSPGIELNQPLVLGDAIYAFDTVHNLVGPAVTVGEAPTRPAPLLSASLLAVLVTVLGALGVTWLAARQRT